jgi:ATP-dependent helicase/nuclease subunit A
MAIDTFHGWFGTLLRGAPLSSGIVPGASLREDALRMKREAWAPFWRALAQPQHADLREAYEALVDAIGDFQARGLLDRMFHARNEWFAFKESGDPATKLAQDLGDDATSDMLVDALCDDDWLEECAQMALLLGRGGKTEQGHASKVIDGLRAIRAWRDAGAAPGEAAANAFQLLRAAFFTDAGKPRSLRRTAALAKVCGSEGAVDECWISTQSTAHAWTRSRRAAASHGARDQPGAVPSGRCTAGTLSALQGRPACDGLRGPRMAGGEADGRRGDRHVPAGASRRAISSPAA